MEITKEELTELTQRRSQQDLQDLVQALVDDGEVVVVDVDDEPEDLDLEEDDY